MTRKVDLINQMHLNQIQGLVFLSWVDLSNILTSASPHFPICKTDVMILSNHRVVVRIK